MGTTHKLPNMRQRVIRVAVAKAIVNGTNAASAREFCRVNGFIVVTAELCDRMEGLFRRFPVLLEEALKTSNR